MNTTPRHSEPHSPANPCTPRCTGHPDHTAREIDAAAAFAVAWEKAQGAIGQILRAYYYGTRPEYVAAVSAAAYAIADLESLKSPRHDRTADAIRAAEVETVEARNRRGWTPAEVDGLKEARP